MLANAITPRGGRHGRATGAARVGAVLATLLVANLLHPVAATGQAARAFASEDFDEAELGRGWEVVDPLGDGTVEIEGAGSGDARLEMTVPEGKNHEPWNVNRSVRVMREANDTDFTTIARFQSVPTKRYQIQGILVQEDRDNWIRFDVYHDGERLRAFAGSTEGRRSTGRVNEEGVAGASSFLRVTRTGDTWALATSADGQNWQEAGSFDADIRVKEVGLFAGNGGGDPGFTAIADYMFEAAQPIEPEDGGVPGGAYPLDVVATGPGAIARSPDKPTYAPGEQVTLTPVVQPGAAFGGWAGDAGGDDTPLLVTVDRPMSITGTFAPDNSAPAISKLSVYPRSNSVQVSFVTDDNATASVQVGPTEAMEYGTYLTTSPSNEHRVTVPGLQPGKAYRYVAHATNTAGVTSTSATGTFVTAAAPSVSFESDDFNRDALEPKPWSTWDPSGDGKVAFSGAGTEDAVMEMTVPAGKPHDGTGALRVMAPAADIDFMAEAKFDAVPSRSGQRTGLLFQQDPNTWTLFSLAFDGTKLRAQGASISGAAATWHVNSQARSHDSIWLRVIRDGDEWTLLTSSSGERWTEVGAFDFPMRVTSVGPFTGNFGAAAPAYTSKVDYVFEGSATISPEDQPEDAPLRDLAVDEDGPGKVEMTPDAKDYVADTEVRLTAVPNQNSYFTGWKGDARGKKNPIDVVLEEDTSITATFKKDDKAPEVGAVSVVPGASSAVVKFRTSELATASVKVGTTPAYSAGAFGSPYLSRDHAITVTGLEAGKTYNFQASGTDRAGHVTATPDATFTTLSGGGPSIDVWNGTSQTFGKQGRSQTWANIGGNASDPDGVASMRYSLNGGEEREITVGPNSRRLQNSGDFNADVPFDDLAVGPNTVRLTAIDRDGSRSDVTVNVERVEGETTLPFTTNWAAAHTLMDEAQPVDGKWTIDGDTVRTKAFGYDRVLALGDTSWHDYEVEFPVTVNAIGPESGSHLSGPALVGFGMNWQGHTQVEDEQPGYFWYPTGALAWYRWYSPSAKWELRGNMDRPIDRDNRRSITFGQTYRFKGRSRTVESGVEYAWKYWPDGAPEPAGWNLKITEDEGPAEGSVVLIAHHADVQFGNVRVRSLH